MNDIKLRIAGTISDSIVDGPGLRFTVFTQGCPHHCPGCHNVKTHDFNGGKEVAISQLFEEIKQNKGITGVTFSGGEPFSQADKLLPLAKLIKEQGLELAIYSGWTFEELNSGLIKNSKELLECADILIDGRFDIKQRSLDLQFRGSKNQRILDVKESIKSNKAVNTTDKRWLCRDCLTDEFLPKNIRAMGF